MKSTSQRAKLHAMADRGEIAKAVVAKFEAATPKGKKLPKKVKPKAKKKKPSGY